MLRPLKQCALACVMLFAPAVLGQNELPEGQGRAIVQRACTGCHELDAVTGTRYTETGWRRSVNDMVSRGAECTSAEIDEMVAYLAKNFGKMNINNATTSRMQEFLGITAKDAQAIVSYRGQNGDIKNMQQLKSIPGVDTDLLQAKAALIAFKD